MCSFGKPSFVYPGLLLVSEGAHLAAGGGVVGGGVDPGDAEAAQFVFEFVASAAGQSGGETVPLNIGQGGGRDALGAIGFLKCRKDDGAGYAAVGADA